MPDQDVRIEIAVAKQTPVVGIAVTATMGSGAGGVADKLATARKIALAGDAQGDTTFDGSQDVKIYTAIEKLSNMELEALLI